MKTGILFAALLSLSGTSAFASSWHNFYSANTDDAEYFFDADSVVKAGGVVTVWVKTVQKNSPESDGSWSIALNWRINCQKRTITILSSSTYDSAGKFIKSNSNVSSETQITPDSVGEGVQKAACMADFPRNTPATKGIYFTLADNDIYAFTRRLVEIKKGQVDNAPK